MPSACVRAWVTGLVALVYLPKFFLMLSIGKSQNTFLPPDTLSDVGMINTQCPHDLNSGRRSLLTTSQTLVIGYANDATHRLINDFRHAGNRVVFLPLFDNKALHFENIHQGQGRSSRRKSHDPGRLRQLLISRDQLPREIHFLADTVTSPGVAKAHDVTALLEDYVDLLQALALEPRLKKLPLYTHLVGTKGTKTYTDDDEEDDCRTDLDYGDLKSILHKQIELYSTVFKQIYKLPVRLLQR